MSMKRIVCRCSRRQFAAGAVNAMCSYNAIDNVPVACDRSLLTEWLRGESRDARICPGGHDCGGHAPHLPFCGRPHHERPSAWVLRRVWTCSCMTFHMPFTRRHFVIWYAVERCRRLFWTQPFRGLLRVKFLLGLFERPYVDENPFRQGGTCARACRRGEEGGPEGCLPVEESGRAVAAVQGIGDHCRAGAQRGGTPVW